MRSSQDFLVHNLQGKPMESRAALRSSDRLVGWPFCHLEYWVRWSLDHCDRGSVLGMW